MKCVLPFHSIFAVLLPSCTSFVYLFSFSFFFCRMFCFSIFLQLLRLKNFQYCRPCFVFRHPTGLVRNVFLQPFTVNVWYCIIVVGFVVIGTTSFISYREKKSSGKIRFVNLSIMQSMFVGILHIFPFFFSFSFHPLLVCFYLFLVLVVSSFFFFFLSVLPLNSLATQRISTWITLRLM